MNPDEIRQQVIDDYMNHVNPSLMRLLAFMGVDQVEESADGFRVTDINGKEWIDCLGGFGVFSLGHARKEIIDTAKAQLDKMPLTSKILLNKPLADLSKKLAEISPGDLQYSFVCNSGTEAVEAALKIARIKTGKKEIIYTDRGFHGKTLGSLSVTGREKFKEKLKPLLPVTKMVPFDDIDALVKTITDETACFIVEPVQAEAGVYAPGEGYFEEVEKVCREKGVLLIMDEVQTGFGRTGKLFASEHYNVHPDIMTLAKALGGGVMPIGAVMGTADVWSVFEENPLIHSSTFGGNPLACAVALRAIELTIDEDLPSKAARGGERFMKGLLPMKEKFSDIITDIRGIGLLIGLDFVDEDTGGLFISAITSRNILVGFALNNPKVIRIEPPLIIDDAIIDHVIECVEGALGDVRSLLGELG